MKRTIVEKYGNLPLKKNARTLTSKVAAHVPDHPVPDAWSCLKYEWPDGMMHDIPSPEHVRYTYGVAPEGGDFDAWRETHTGHITFSGPDSYYVYPNGKRVLWPGTRSIMTVLRSQFEFERTLGPGTIGIPSPKKTVAETPDETQARVDRILAEIEADRIAHE